SFSFFEIDKAYADKVLQGFEHAEFGGRAVIVEITKKPKGGRSRSGRGGFGGGRKSRDNNRSGGGGYKGNRSSSRSGGKKGGFGGSKRSRR
ncbi:MAG TPA: ATP-dependent RNA helicase, partial [Flavobacteriaceae bacterium]|nr:ATP-dependent RNA helicase [Flavobacteriaceae bacterium]